MKLILISGYSGAGKSQALKTFEDLGYETMDNVPLKALAGVIHSMEKDTSHLAVCSDIRARDFSASTLAEILKELRVSNDVTLLFLSCEQDMLVKRFTETRHRHPLAQDRPVTDGILLERRLLHDVRDMADLVIDTSEYGPHDLKRRITETFSGESHAGLRPTIMSFSFRRGIPRDADIVLDVRFLRNPHYEADLQSLTGKQPPVAEYIRADAAWDSFIGGLSAWLLPLLPRYLQEGKSYLTIAVGCTGGKHRSVFVVETLSDMIKKAGYDTFVRHRELDQHATRETPKP